MLSPPNGRRKGILERIAYRVMKERGFLPDFSRAALNDLKNIQQDDVGAKSLGKDLRQLLWASIDNDVSLDLDQLTVAEALPDKTVKILVAVADVDALVKKNSAIDEHARQNTTSVYTAGKTFPMLPEKLSTDLTSLNYQEDRPAMVIEMAIDEMGKIQSSDIYRALVATAPSWPTTVWRPGWKAMGPCRRPWPLSQGWQRISVSKTGWRSD